MKFYIITYRYHGGELFSVQVESKDLERAQKEVETYGTEITVEVAAGYSLAYTTWYPGSY